MKVTITVETTSPNGTRDVHSEVVEKDVIVLGRGAGSDVRLESGAAALTHAQLSVGPTGQVIIEDLGSLGGVLLNDTPVSRQALRVGDKLSLADIQFEVRARPDGLELFREKRREEKLDLDAKIRRDLMAVHVPNRLPSFKLLSLSLAALVIGLFFVWPVLTEHKGSWSSGPIAAPHQMVGHDCTACHEGNFKAVSDKNCLSCHQLTAHAEVFKHVSAEKSTSEPSCASCHMDHNGPHGLIVRQAALCTDCHANIDSFMTARGNQAAVRNIPDFASHPQFAVTLQPESVGAVPRRVSLDEPAKLKDVSNVKLNHKVHLQPNLRTKTGRKTLQCADCHALSDNFRTIKKIEFETHCQECHTLEFDERLPKREVPHGDPDVVYRFLYAEYAKLLLGSTSVSSPTRTEFQQRGGRIPGKTSVAVVEAAKAPDDFSRSFVEQESRGAEKILFTKTACYLCHGVGNNKAPSAEIKDRALSFFTVLKPQIPERWMPKSIFSHGSHEEVSCEECHSGVRESELTADVLLPKIETCKDCHAEISRTGHPEKGKVSGDCITCHSYHDSQPIPAERKRPIKDIVAGLKL